ncbi:MAG: hypothetical protein AAF388_00105 [Bacteroidota bacterium]
MIHALLTEIVTVLRTEFTGSPSFPNPNDQIVVGPASPSSSEQAFVSVEQSSLIVNAKGHDIVSSEPRPTPNQEVLSISGQGPYSLARTPLEGTVLVRTVFPAGNTQVLTPNKDFRIDFTVPSLSLIGPNLPGNAAELSVNYSYVGVFTIRNFTQQFHLKVFNGTTNETESWASLITAIILTNHDDLLTDFNSTQYILENYSAEHRLSKLVWQSSSSGEDQDIDYLALDFEVQGQITFIKEISGGFGIIEQILSPQAFNDNSTLSVDISPNLD